MTDEPTNENESLLKFPCDFPIKIFGLSDSQFESTALNIIQKYIPGFRGTDFKARPSENNKYMALSVTVHVDSKEQLDSIYRELSGSPDILMVL